MSETFTVRTARLDDAEALRAIYNHAVIHTTATMDLTERTAEQQLAWMAAHNGKPYPALVAVAEGQDCVVGYASLSPFDYMPGYSRTVENSLYVHPEWHGRGIGRLLLARLIEASQQTSFTSIIALISADNDASLYLHRQLGFMDAGLLRAVGYKHGRAIDVAYLQYVLRPESP